MGAQAHWLERLEHSTNYEDLREVFEGMASDAEAVGTSAELAASIDMAMHVVAERHLGVPQSNAEAFALLEKAGIIGAAVGACQYRA